MAKNIESLVAQLEDESPTVVDAAIEELAGYGRRAIPALREKMLKKSLASLRVLIRMGFPENQDAIPEVIRLLKYSGSHPPTERVACQLLGEIGLPVLPQLISVLVSYPDAECWVREVSGILLTYFNDRVIGEFSEVLTQALDVGFHCEHEYYVNVVKLIGRVGSPRADRAVRTLGRFVLNSRDPEVRTAAACALRGFSTSAIEEIREVLRHVVEDETTGVRMVATELLARISHTP